MSCLLIMLGGCNTEYINASLTPFLHNLKQTGSYVNLRATPSFKTRIELFSGNFPSTTGTFTDFVSDPEKSPFRFLKFPAGSNNKLRRGKISRQILKVFLHFCGGNCYRYALKPLNIPLSLLPYFRLDDSAKEFFVKEKQKAKEHFFGTLEQNGFHLVSCEGQEETFGQEIIGRPISEKEVLFLHYGKLDKYAHIYGPNSPEVRQLLKTIDDSIAEIYHFLEDKISFTAIFGDHNMVEVEENINLWEKMMELKAKPVTDYVVFINSPLARFWFKNEEAKREITEFLMRLDKYGKVVTEDKLRQWRIPTEKKYGELIFWLRKGVNISPDFYHESELKGMHHYLDDPMETPLIICHKNKRLKLKAEARTVDIVPTILDLLSIEFGGMDGRSLIDEIEPK